MTLSRTEEIRRVADEWEFDKRIPAHRAARLLKELLRRVDELDERLRAVRRLLEENGCDCPCDHHPDERGPDCEVCLACRIAEAVGK